MSDFKTKLPDFKELTSMASKFCKDVKTSISEIIADYKQKHNQETARSEAKSKKEEVTKTTTTTQKNKAAKKADSEKDKA